MCDNSGQVWNPPLQEKSKLYVVGTGPKPARARFGGKKMLTAVVGINWGDEGKGRMVDLLSEQYDIIARYQGGNNAGHTVINDRGKFILN